MYINSECSSAAVSNHISICKQRKTSTQIPSKCDVRWYPDCVSRLSLISSCLLLCIPIVFPLNSCFPMFSAVSDMMWFHANDSLLIFAARNTIVLIILSAPQKKYYIFTEIISSSDLQQLISAQEGHRCSRYTSFFRGNNLALTVR